MTESSWEASRSAQQKKLHLLLLILLPVFLLGGILFINNRDLLVSDTRIATENENEPDTKQESRSFLIKTDSAAVRSAEPVTPRAQRPAQTGMLQPQKVAAEKKEIPETKKTVPYKKAKPVIVAKVSEKKITVKKTPEPLSEILPPVRCSLRSRKDIVISLSLELFFNDEDTRPTVRMYRDDIKVLVMKCVLEKELSDMKIHILEKHLLKSINSIFEHEIVISLKIRNIQIEKAKG